MATYYVDAVAGSDSNAGTAEGSGNAWQTIQKAANTISNGDKVWVKASADYTEQVTLATSMSNLTMFEGYSSTIGDNGKATIQGSNSRSYCLSSTSKYHYGWKNFIFEGATTASMQLNTQNAYWWFGNCIFRPGTGSGSTAGANLASSASAFVNCLFDGFSGNGIEFSGSSPDHFAGCTFSNNGNYGLLAAFSTVYAIKCVFVDNATIGLRGNTNRLDFCTFANNRDGVFTTATCQANGCIFASHNGATSYGVKHARAYKCFFYDNTTDIDGLGVGSYGYDIENTYLSTDPFTDSASGDYTILSNSPAYQGASFVAGYTDYQDAGALQHADPSGGGGAVLHPLRSN